MRRTRFGAGEAYLAERSAFGNERGRGRAYTGGAMVTPSPSKPPFCFAARYTAAAILADPAQARQFETEFLPHIKDLKFVELRLEEMERIRNIIAHNYFGIDAEEVWQIIEDTLIDLETKLKTIIN